MMWWIVLAVVVLVVLAVVVRKRSSGGRGPVDMGRASRARDKGDSIEGGNML
jgi:hypothetical protein